jgi:hypothetical protein
MTTSVAEVAIAIKLAELAKRCGLKASHVDAAIEFNNDESGTHNCGDIIVSFVDCSGPSEEKEKYFKLLGLKGNRAHAFSSMEDLEDLVDHALSLAPRSRSI